MAPLRAAAAQRSAGNRGRGASVLCLVTLAMLALWAASPSEAGEGANAAFTPAVVATRKGGATALRVGREWRAGNVPKPSGKGGGAPRTFGGGGKKKIKKVSEIDKTPPKVFQSSPIIYQGKEVGTINGTIPEYVVDIWSGAHPVWQGKKGKVLLDASSVTKFQERWGGSADVFGNLGLEQVEKNKELKAEQEARRAAGLKSY
mmetsp:Transcript_6027/g.13793  ORF Transcript_6027/g.13793 Transcript_6027/m.13793 type:complete len:203 (+) Transcript_6027:55-663(+)